MTRNEVIQKQKDYIFPCVATYYSDPLVADHAQGKYVWDIDGRRYLDFFGGILTISLGHCNPNVTGKIKEQLDLLQHTSTAYLNEQVVALAEKLAQITPGRLQKSFFTNSGTEANESGVLLARMATGSFEVVALRHGYSGHSLLAKSLTGLAPWRRGGVISVGVTHAINPYCYRCPLGLTYPNCGLACANDVENVIQATTSGKIAAFLAEPIQGVGGVITPPKEYFKIVFNIVKKYGGLFVSDEVQTGFGRTGRHWFGIEHWGVEPDILTTAKGMANGAPVGATIAAPEVADAFQGMTISTFGGNPVTAAAARATIQVIEEEKLLDNADEMGTYLRASLDQLQEKHLLVGNVRGMGLMQGLELVKDRKTKEPAPQETNALMERCKTNGLLIGKGGLYGNVLRLSPALNVGKAEIEEAIRILDKSLSEMRV
jgi:4-aminobutyrate aminotransferase-like enzyme